MQQAEMRRRILLGFAGGIPGASLFYVNAQPFAELWLSLLILVAFGVLTAYARPAVQARARMHADLKVRGVWSYPLPAWPYVLASLLMIALIFLPLALWHFRERLGEHFPLLLNIGWALLIVLLLAMMAASDKETTKVFRLLSA